MPERPVRFIAAAAAALMLAVALFACGGGGDGGENVSQVLDQTFRSGQKVDSGKLTLDASAKLEGVAQLSGGPVSVKMNGPFDGLDEKIADTGKIPRADLKLSASAAGQTLQAGFTSTGDKLYLNFRGKDYVLPESQFRRLKRQLAQAQAEDQKDNSPDLEALGIRPRNWLKDASNEGTEEIDGVETVHVKGGVDVNKMLDDFDRLLKRANELNLSQQQLRQLPGGIPKSTKQQIVDAVDKAELDLYTGKDDKVLRKLTAKIKFNVPENLRQQAGGLRSGEVDFALQVTEVNKPQTIEAPKSAKPLSQLQRELGTSGFGSLGGQSGSGTQTTPGGGSSRPSKRQSRRYLKCVQKAKVTAELNQCAQLLR